MPTSRPTAARRLIAGAVCVALSGCSFVTVQRPRPPAEVEDPRVLEPCTTSPAAPVVDHVVAVAALLVGFTAYFVTTMGDCAGTECRRPDHTLPIAAFATGGAFAGSAAYGYATTARCRHVREDDRRCANGDVWTCQKLSPGWPPPPGWRAAGAVLEPGPASAPPAPAPQDPSGPGTPAAPVPVVETREQSLPVPPPGPGGAR